jgi:hypothetical protein
MKIKYIKVYDTISRSKKLDLAYIRSEKKKREKV